MDIVCFSHLRWQFVFQRPQHLLSRAAATRRVVYIEEPEFSSEPATLRIERATDAVWVVTPRLETGTPEHLVPALQAHWLDVALEALRANPDVLWYYTPMALDFTRHLSASVVVYDCMDELSLFKGAPRVMKARERELLEMADLVFTGGQSLYESKKHSHSSVHCFPSSVDVEHFRSARFVTASPEDQRHIPRPRIGYAGVIDERMDLDLIAGIADARPEWHLVMLGPVTKLDENDLPRRDNIHYLGGRSYTDLPRYMGGWDVAMLPFALNESTRFISPTKTPEYLAAGLPTVSTPIRDVERQYGDTGLVAIAGTVAGFVAAIEDELSRPRASRLRRVDRMLEGISWDRTWSAMDSLIEASIAARRPILQQPAYAGDAA